MEKKTRGTVSLAKFFKMAARSCTKSEFRVNSTDFGVGENDHIISDRSLLRSQKHLTVVSAFTTCCLIFEKKQNPRFVQINKSISSIPNMEDALGLCQALTRIFTNGLSMQFLLAQLT